MVRMSAADAAGVDTDPDADADIIGAAVLGSIPRNPALRLGLDAKFHSLSSLYTILWAVLVKYSHF